MHAASKSAWMQNIPGGQPFVARPPSGLDITIGYRSGENLRAIPRSALFSWTVDCWSIESESQESQETLPRSIFVPPSLG